MKNQELIKSITNYLKKNLSKKRYTHSLNVAKTAKKLAEIYGEDEDRAYLAGLVHDVAKEEPKQQLLLSVLASKRDVCVQEKQIPALYHAIAGAERAEEIFGIDDEEILTAVRYHTVCAGGLSKLCYIIYIADLTSEDRDYKDVTKMRKLSVKNLDAAMLEALSFSIKDTVNKGSLVPHCTLAAYNQFVNIVNKER